MSISIGRGQGTDELLGDVGRSVRKPADGGQAAADRYSASLLRVFALLFVMFNYVKHGLLVFTGIPFALTCDIRSLDAWRSHVALGRSWLHCARWRGRAERAGHDRVHHRPARSWEAASGRSARRCADEVAPGSHDRTRRIARLRADGNYDRYRCGYAAALCDGRHRRLPVVHRADPAAVTPLMYYLVHRKDDQA